MTAHLSTDVFRLALGLTLAVLGPPTLAVSQDKACPDPHDAPELACSLGDDTTFQDVMSAAGGRNVYRFETNAPGARVQIDLTDLPADYDLYLVDSGGNIVDQSVHEGTTAENLDRTLDSAGTFYVYVVADPGRAADTSAPYTLGIRLTSSKSEWTLLRSDNFSDPAGGLFADKQAGTGSVTTTSDQVTHRYEWQSGYQDGALVGRLRGMTPPFRLSGSFTTRSAAAAGKIFGDFAVDVDGRAVGPTANTGYGLAYASLRGGYYFWVAPGDASYAIRFYPDYPAGRAATTLTSGRARAVNGGGDWNHLRLEVRGDSMVTFVNGEQVDRAQRPGPAEAPGTVGVVWLAFGPGPSQDVEARFADFKVYALGS